LFNILADHTATQCDRLQLASCWRPSVCLSVMQWMWLSESLYTTGLKIVPACS